jgi:hypothetical protein
MSTKRNISILIGIIGILILLLAGSIGYIIANENYKSKSNGEFSVDNSKVLKEIEELKQLYDAKIADKTNNYISLQIQKDSIENLVSALENSKSDANALVKYKTQYKNLESKMKILVNEIVVLKSRKTSAITKKSVAIVNDSPTKNNSEITAAKTEIIPNKKENPNSKIEQTIVKPEIVSPKTVVVKEDKPAEKNEIISKKSDKNSRITLSDVKASAYISKSAIKKIPTDDAGRADLIKISFTIDGNSNESAGEKTYYFQILSNKNNVMGKRITEYFDNEALTYSFSKSFNYDSQAVQVSQEFLSASFEKGYYFVNIFDRDQLVGKASFQLK